jgi:hypothetical protein
MYSSILNERRLRVEFGVEADMGRHCADSSAAQTPSTSGSRKRAVSTKRKIGSPALLNEGKAPIRKRRFSVRLDVEIEVNALLLTDVLTDERRVRNHHR